MNKKALTVGQFYSDNCHKLKLQLLNSNAGFERIISTPELHRPGLALAGFLDVFTYDRIQILGNTEIRYLFSLSEKKRRESLERVLDFDIPCLIITHNNNVPPELLSITTRKQICLFRTKYTRTVFSHFLIDYLNSYFAPQTTVHGTLVDVYGIGVLFTGRSGIGKSEIALDLVERGHRLVADDVVLITKKAEEILMGEAREIAEHHLEIRGLGLIDVRRIFGVRSVRVHKRVEVEVKLVDFDAREDYERTGLNSQTTSILGVEIPTVILPINPGKNITVIAETIALNQLLKIYGHHTPEEFNEKLMEKIRQQEREHLLELKMRDFLDKDFE
ncbi:HPr kinase/phosphorylase [candidate division KSB1 bacterium 4484_188]|nr:MAG: HPr kinase/phosphorylase [candidate division KSB1 bacterium 4484_188]